MVVIGYILFGIIALLICLFCFVQIRGFVRDIKMVREKKKNKNSSTLENNEVQANKPSTCLNKDDD